MCVFKYHAFIYFLRPPPWYGTFMLIIYIFYLKWCPFTSDSKFSKSTIVWFVSVMSEISLIWHHHFLRCRWCCTSRVSYTADDVVYAVLPLWHSWFGISTVWNTADVSALSQSPLNHTLIRVSPRIWRKQLVYVSGAYVNKNRSPKISWYGLFKSPGLTFQKILNILSLSPSYNATTWYSINCVTIRSHILSGGGCRGSRALTCYLRYTD